MKILKNKGILKKLIVVFLCVILLNFCIPKTAMASDDGVGGKLLSPVVDLLMSIGDATMNIIHTVIYDQNETVLTVDMTNSILKVVAVIAIFIVSAVIIGAIVHFGVGALVAKLVEKGLKIATVSWATTIIVSTTGGVVATSIISSNVLPDNLQLPVYLISPEKIFSNEIALFDVNFFNPNDETKVKKGENKEEIEIGSVQTSSSSDVTQLNKLLSDNGISRKVNATEFASNYSGKEEDVVTFTENGITYIVKRENLNQVASSYLGQNSTYKFTLYKYNTVLNEGDVEYLSIAYQLRPIISNWYVALRNIAIVALLSVLVYTGIRILISSTSNDKAKYKQLLIDWVVAICLLFMMQYIMAASNLLVDKITEVFKSTKSDEGYTELIEDKDGKIEKALTDGGYDVSALKMEVEGKNFIQWKTNLLGIAKIRAQLAKQESSSYAGYAIIFIVLVLFTVYFIYTYLKRVLYMAFLTLIAPMVAMTYPIDKMNDGKAQAFNAWFKEYIFNLLIQPLHLLLYTILVTSAFELASTNIIYSLVALGFMIPAEKLLRKFFGFSKAETPGALGGAAGAAVMMSGINKLLHKPPKDKNGSGKGKASDERDDGAGVRYKDSIDSEAELFGEGNPKEDIQFKPDDLGDTNTAGDTANTGRNDMYSSTNTEDDTVDTGINMGRDTMYSSTNTEDDTVDTRKNDMYSGSNTDGSINDTETNSKKGVIRKIKDGVSSLGSRIGNNSKMVREGKAGMKFFGRGMKQKIEDKKNNADHVKAIPKVKGVTRKIKDGVSSLGSRIGDSKMVRAGKAGMKFYGRGMKQKIEDKINNADPVKAIPKAIGGATVATLAGGVALAAGITSGDVSKAAQYTGAATVAGWSAGGAAGKGIAKTLSVDGTFDAMEEAYYGEEEYKQRKIEENIRNVKNDYKIRAELEKRLKSEKAAAEAMQDGGAVEYAVRYGLQDANEIAAVYERSRAGEDWETAVSQVKYVKEYGKDTSKLGHKDSRELNKTIEDRVRKYSKKGTSEEQIQKNIEMMRNKFDATSKIMYKKL